MVQRLRTVISIQSILSALTACEAPSFARAVPEPLGWESNQARGCHFLVERVLSSESLPAPRSRMASSPSSMQKSTRASCMADQKPCFNSRGILVVAIATAMSITRGTAAKAVKKPAISRVPQTISTIPTNGPVNPGAGIPIFSNRPAPSSSGWRNFRMPSEMKTAAVSRRMRMTDAILRKGSCEAAVGR